MTKTRSLRSEAGIAITLALGFMVVVLVIAAGVHSLVIGQLRASGAVRQQVTAEELANGGLARAVAWFSSSSYQPPASGTLLGPVPVRLSSTGLAVVLPSSHPNAYTDALGQSRKAVVDGFNQYLTKQTNSVGTYSVQGSLMALQPETWELVVTAKVGAVTRQVGGRLLRAQSASQFQEAVFGAGFVDMSGAAMTDSYDSSLGAYGGSNRFASGSVRANGDVTMSGSAQVNGDAIPGPKKTVLMNGNPKVTGLKTPADTARTLAPVTVPAGAVALGALNVLNNDRRTLTAGTYVATSMNIGGSGELKIDTTAGAVNLYVTGTVTVGGNSPVYIVGGGPGKFNINVVGNGTVDIGGSGRLTGSIYAPGSNLKIDGNADLYGSFVGAGVTIAGSASVHFDQALRTGSGGGSGGLFKLVAQWNLPPISVAVKKKA